MPSMNMTPFVLALLLTGCGGGSDASPDEPADGAEASSAAPSADAHASVDPSTTPAATPPSDPASPDAVRTRARAVLADLASLTKVEVEADDGGDLTRTVVGYKRGAELVAVTDVLDVGEYGRVELRYVLEKGAPVVRLRDGFSHDPIDGQDARFKKFEEQVVYGTDGAVVDARERAVYTDGHPPEGTALPAGWTPVENAEKAEISEILALFN